MVGRGGPLSTSQMVILVGTLQNALPGGGSGAARGSPGRIGGAGYLPLRSGSRPRGL
jgi:hypothetical protein